MAIGFRLLTVIFIAWLALILFQVLRGITISGWMLIACIALSGVVLFVLAWIAHKVFDHLSERVKTIFKTAGYIISSILYIVAGILLWHQIQKGDFTTVIVIAVFFLIGIIKVGYEKYIIKTVEQTTTADGDE